VEERKRACRSRELCGGGIAGREPPLCVQCSSGERTLAHASGGGAAHAAVPCPPSVQPEARSVSVDSVDVRLSHPTTTRGLFCRLFPSSLEVWDDRDYACGPFLDRVAS
jgi:hypothetical protein